MPLLSQDTRDSIAEALGVVALAVVIALCGVLLGVIVVGFVLLMAVATVVDLVWAGIEWTWAHAHPIR